MSMSQERHTHTLFLVCFFPCLKGSTHTRSRLTLFSFTQTGYEAEMTGNNFYNIRYICVITSLTLVCVLACQINANLCRIILVCTLTSLLLCYFVISLFSIMLQYLYYEASLYVQYKVSSVLACFPCQLSVRPFSMLAPFQPVFYDSSVLACLLCQLSFSLFSVALVYVLLFYWS